LELLLELQALGDTWYWHGRKEKTRVKHQADLKDFQLSIQRQQDWFAATGELKLDKDLVLDMQQLLELLIKPQVVLFRLVTVNSLALTFKRLDELRAFSEKHSKVYAFTLATLGLKDLIDEVGKVKQPDKHWKAHIQL